MKLTTEEMVQYLYAREKAREIQEYIKILPATRRLGYNTTPLIRQIFHTAGVDTAGIILEGVKNGD